MTSDGANGREHILDAMVELGHQHALAFVCPLAISDVDVDANKPLGTPIAVVSNEGRELAEYRIREFNMNSFVDFFIVKTC